MKNLSGSLFATPSIFEGIGRIMDFGDSLSEFNRSENPDRLAAICDWMSVYNDLRASYVRERLKSLDQPALDFSVDEQTGRTKG